MMVVLLSEDIVNANSTRRRNNDTSQVKLDNSKTACCKPTGCGGQPMKQPVIVNLRNVR